MLRSIIAIAALWMTTQAHAGVIGIFGGMSLEKETVDTIPEVKIDPVAYSQILNRLMQQSKVEARFPNGEQVELTNVMVGNQPIIIETNMNRKFTPRDW